tara:strand:+ start:27204 stop:28106 length:903 start_codon:yes stop_codon:yes gene_type:complete
LNPFYLHVGLPRCASTLIEHAFFSPKHEGYRQLRSDGILPLQRLCMEFRRAYALAEWTEDQFSLLWDYHISPLHHHDSPAFFTSDEGLTGIDDQAGHPLPYLDRAPFLTRLLNGFDVRIILLVRHQARYVVSMYGLHLQNGGTTDFATYVADFPVHRLNWLAVAEAFASAFGEDAVTVIPFDRELHPAKEGAPKDFMEAFQRSMNVSAPIPLSDMPLVNPSLRPEFFDAQLRLNRGEASSLEEGAVPEGEAAHFNATGKSPMTETQSTAIMASMSDSNRELFARFMPQYDAGLYQPGGIL